MKIGLWKKRLGCLTLAAGLLMANVPPALAAEDSPDAETGTEVVEDLSEYSNHQALVMYANGDCDVMTYASQEALAAGLESLAADENVTLVQPNYTYETSGLSTNDPLLSKQWALSNDGTFKLETGNSSPARTPSAPYRVPWQHGPRRFSTSAQSGQTAAAAGVDVNAEQAWEIYGGGSRDVIVAMVDTGLDYTHEDLKQNIWVNTDEIPGNGIDDDGNGYIDDVYGWNFYWNNNRVYTGQEDEHGTHGAGTIAAAADNGVGVAGLASGGHVQVMAVKALGGKDGTGTTASIIQAIRYAEANGAQICNLSLGTTRDDRALYQAMADSNMLFVVAAGNDGTDADQTPCYPASYDLDNILSVANLSYDGTLHESSNYGAVSIDLAAPGTDILSTTPQNTYGYMTGTSMAAPMVSAAAAMVYSYAGDITPAQVKNVLLVSAQPMESLEGRTVTGGMLDIGAALSYIAGQA